MRPVFANDFGKRSFLTFKSRLDAEKSHSPKEMGSVSKEEARGGEEWRYLGHEKRNYAIEPAGVARQGLLVAVGGLLPLGGGHDQRLSD